MTTYYKGRKHRTGQLPPKYHASDDGATTRCGRPVHRMSVTPVTEEMWLRSRVLRCRRCDV